MNVKMRSALCVAAMLPVLAVGACSQDDANKAGTAAGQAGNAASSAASQAGQGASSAASAVTPREASKDVKVTKCEVKNGSAHVEASIANSDGKGGSYVIPVTVEQNGKTVDTLALLGNVEQGKPGTASMDGNKTDLKGEITCKVGDVQAM